MIERLLLLIFCHMIGDYVLQSDFIAKTKGENWWHLAVHCTLYILPFYLLDGYGRYLVTMWVHHFIVDVFKAKYKVINYVEDQIYHFVLLLMLL